MSNRDDLQNIADGLMALHRASFQPKSWTVLQQRAGITLDRADVALLKAVVHCDRPQCRMQDIAQYLGIEAPSVTRKVQDLEARQLLHRRSDPEDKRASIVQITAQGTAAILKLQQARIQQLELAMHNWPSADRKEFARLLQQLADDLHTT